MKNLRVLLVETTRPRMELLKRRLLEVDSVKSVVTIIGTGGTGEIFRNAADRLDVILFGEKVHPSALLHMTKLFRSYNQLIPIFILRKQSEAKVPQKYRKAGVDDVMNVMEIGTPLFSWTLISTVEHALFRRKAEKYDDLHDRLENTSKSLAHLAHDINNPLGVIRLAMYHLDNPSITAEKREAFIKILIGNLDKIDNHLKEIQFIRRRLNGETVNTPKIFSLGSQPHAGIST